MDIERLQPWPHATPPAPDMCGEDARMQVIEEYDLDSLHDDPELAAIAEFAAQLCKAPTAMVSLIEAERQRFLGRTGHDACETSRDTSICAHTMLGHDVLEVPDATQDERFASFALVTGDTHLRYYAGYPLISHEGAPLGALCVIDTQPRTEPLDATQRTGLKVLAQAVMRRLRHRREFIRQNLALQASRTRLQTLIDSLPDIAYAINADGTFDYMNAQFDRIVGQPHPRNAEDWRALVHPDDHEPLFTNWYETFARGEPFEGQFRLLQADGSWRWNLTRVLPVQTHGDDALTWFGTLTDIEDSHREAEVRQLIANELSHRIKNIFAVIGGLISLKSREYPGSEAFTADVSDTLHALNRAHAYVTQKGSDTRETLHGLLGKLMQPYGDRSGSRFALDGTDVPVSPKSATPLALVFHELATNSAKYGALSVAEGTIAITTTLHDGTVTIVWQETGGPPPAADRGAGFGSRLVERSVSHQLAGTLARDFTPAGLVATLCVPADTL